MTEEYQSTGLLWPQRVRFSGDRRWQKCFSGMDRDTFERTIGHFLLSIINIDRMPRRTTGKSTMLSKSGMSLNIQLKEESKIGMVTQSTGITE